MSEKLCRNCSFFTYHNFCGFCSKKGIDTVEPYGYSDPCEYYDSQTESQEQKILKYEEYLKNLIK